MFAVKPPSLDESSGESGEIKVPDTPSEGGSTNTSTSSSHDESE